MRRLFNIKTVYIVAAIIVASTVLVVWLTDRGPIWINGMSYIANDIDEYHNKAYPIDGKYNVQIDLSNLESNEGTVLFDDEKNKIFISEISHNNSNYEVVFRSNGTFDTTGATLVSGIKYDRDKNSFTTNLKAKAEATYKDITYQLRPSRSSGLNFRDGDEFGFSLSPSSGEVDIDLEKETIINVSVTDLFINFWSKKIN